MPDIRKSLTDQGADLEGGTPEDFATFMREEQTAGAQW